MRKFWIAITFLFIVLTSLFPSVAAQTTVISLEPASIKIPFLDLEHGEIVFPVNLTFTDISEMKKFSIILTFDGSMLEYYTDHAGDWGYSGSRSTNPQSTMVTMSGELKDSRIISGSGTFYSFSFKVTDCGSSQILLQYAYFEDASGSEIPYFFANNNVTLEVYSVETSSGEGDSEVLQTYAELLDDYVELETANSELTEDYDSLLSDYSGLESDFSVMSADYDSLFDDYQLLKSTYDEIKLELDLMNQTHNELLVGFEGLETENLELMSDYSDLQLNYSSLSQEQYLLSEELKIKKDDLFVNSSLMYVFVITTVIFGLTTGYLVKRKKR